MLTESNYSLVLHRLLREGAPPKAKVRMRSADGGKMDTRARRTTARERDRQTAVTDGRCIVCVRNEDQSWGIPLHETC